MIKGKATPEATKEFSGKYPAIKYKTFGKTGFTVSACGFGCYRVDFRVKEHFDSLEYAISKGINLIDTSANYSDGGSETLIGNVLTGLTNSGKLRREEIIIVSKGGYIQGKNYAHAKKLKDEGKGYKEVTEYADNLWHSINPEFIHDQVTNSLDKMKLETIDVYLLHNPEYFLDSPLARDLNLDELRHEYYNRITKAFEQLEKEAAEGRISYYGISSNSFGKSVEEQVFTSLTECRNIAEKLGNSPLSSQERGAGLPAEASAQAGGEVNRFAVIQFPFNLIESGAIKELNQFAETMTLVDYAKKHNFGTMVNRPLNAITPEGLRRLADFEVNPENTKLEEAQIIAEINLLESMEDDFLKEYMPLLELSEEIKENITAFMKAGVMLKENWKNFSSIENFNDIKKRFLIPRVNSAISTIAYSSGVTPEMQAKLDKIAKQINKLSGIIESIYGLMANINSKSVHEALNNAIDDDDFHALPLSQKALGMLVSLDSIDCVLVGMRQNKYVDDVIESMQPKKIDNAAEVWKELEFK